MLVDCLPDPVFVKDRGHRWVYLNDACCDFIGYPRRELIGKSDYEFFPKEQADVFWQRDNHVFETGKCDHNVEGFTDASGVLHTIATRKSLVRLADGTPVLVGVIRDVTHVYERQREWERALHAAREQLNSVIDLAPVAIITFDKDGCIQMVRGRPVPRELADSFLHQSILEVSRSSATFRDAVCRVLDGDKVNIVEEIGGQIFEVQFVPASDGDDALSGGIAVAHDITERHALEKRLSQTEKVESMGRLARGVAHDFNNLLTIIQSALDLAQLSVGRKRPANSEKPLKVIRDAADRAARLTRQLLAFAKEQVVRLEAVNLNVLISEMEYLLRRVVGDDVDLRIELCDDEAWVRVDAGQIEQVLLNLCVNAREAMPDGGELRIETSLTNRGDPELASFVEIRVSDTGIGMDKETLEMIFEPLFTTREHGMGIGLSTCHAIITRMNGKIGVESKVGKGTTFRVFLPYLDEAQEVVAAPNQRVEAAQAKATVLLVEDDGILRSTVAAGLEELGYRVIASENGETAKETVETGVAIDIIVTDVVMPKMSGPQFVAWVDGRIPSIFVTGYADDVLIRHGLADREMDFLHKPYTLMQLHEKISEVLGRSHARVQA
jgi:PAS domain S-box-containing protein